MKIGTPVAFLGERKPVVPVSLAPLLKCTAGVVSPKQEI